VTPPAGGTLWGPTPAGGTLWGPTPAGGTLWGPPPAGGTLWGPPPAGGTLWGPPPAGVASCTGGATTTRREHRLRPLEAAGDGPPIGAAGAGCIPVTNA
jgi:hypothetical protein